MLLLNVLLSFICLNHVFASPQVTRNIIVPPTEYLEDIEENTLEDMLGALKREIDEKFDIMEKNIIDALDKKFKENAFISRCPSQGPKENKVSDSSQTLDLFDSDISESRKKTKEDIDESTSSNKESNRETKEDSSHSVSESYETSTQLDIPEAVEEKPKPILLELASKGCKEFMCTSDLINYNTYFDIDKDLTNTVVKRNGTGDLTYFETHFVVPRNTITDILALYIRLSLTKEKEASENVYETIWYYYTQHISLYVNNNHKFNDLLQNSDDYMAFYIKISDEEFQFGKDEDNSTLINFKNKGIISPIKYLSFDVQTANKLPFYYDCPNNFKTV